MSFEEEDNFIPEILDQKEGIKSKNRKFEKSYEVENSKIAVTWKEFVPQKEGPLNDRAVIFLSGWSAGTAETLEDLTQDFAEHSSGKAFLVTTRPEKNIPQLFTSGSKSRCPIYY